MLADRKTKSDHRYQLSDRYPERYPLPRLPRSPVPTSSDTLLAIVSTLAVILAFYCKPSDSLVVKRHGLLKQGQKTLLYIQIKSLTVCNCRLPNYNNYQSTIIINFII